MDSNDDLTIGARVKGWEIFTPDWDYLQQYSTLQLASLCALSVGLHPAFADPSWVFNVAKPHFDGTDSDEFCPLEDAEEGEKRAALLRAFLQRVNIAAAELCPRGTLPIADGAADAERTVVNVASFASWAAGKGWKLPPEFPKPLAAPVSIQPAATSGAPDVESPKLATGITIHKLRQNSLDAPIRKAIEMANSRSTSAVYIHLRELALSGELPFTGAFEGAAICYTNDEGRPAKLSKDALGKRIKNL